MKKIIIMCVAALLALQIAQAQGIVYVSNLGQTSTVSESIGSNSWYAANFHTGNNVGGYILNYIQLAMTNASGNPSGFTAMLYGAANIPAATLPGSSLGTLNGSLNPVTAGTYTYTAPSNLILSPSTYYFIVVTAGTSVANGAYEWSVEDTSPPFSMGWSQVNDFFQSSNGSSWIGNLGALEFAINATAVPEPSSSFLLLLGSGVLIYVR